MKYLFLFGALALVAVAPSHADIIISEVVAWGNNNTAYNADWFELTNTGASAVMINGWTMDDDSNNPNSALLSGVTSIAPGQSVIFIELAGGGNANALTTGFINTWFGGSAPAGFLIGTYTQGVAGGVGLGTGGDAVNIFNGVAGTLQARVAFGSATTSAPFASFDNAGGLNNTTISQLSVAGVNGAFVAANDANETGSPGVVPEPQTYMMFVSGVAFLGALLRRRRR